MVLKDQIGKNDSFLKCFLLKDSGSLRNLQQVWGMLSEEKRGNSTAPDQGLGGGLGEPNQPVGGKTRDYNHNR